MVSKKDNFADLFANSGASEEPLQDDFATFTAGVKPLEQDKIHFAPTTSNKNRAKASNNLNKDRANSNKDHIRANASFHFSDEYEPLLEPGETLSYVKEGCPKYLAKVLRRGDVAPEVILDLHGYNKEQAKFDIAELIETCKREQLPCACIVHGVSGGILKRKVPHYLIQHPDVAAIHQAPLEWGGQGAVLFIVDLGEELDYLLKT